MTVLTPADDRVRKFQKTGDHGSRLRKTSASNAISATRPGLPGHNPLGSQRRTAKVPLGPRGPPQDFHKHR
jgi:dual specificity tyrosine-phosphorylation-regulated kinase 2/3/4